MRTALEKTLYGDNQSASGHSTETFCSYFLKNYQKMINDYGRKLKGLNFLHYKKCLCRRKISKSYFFIWARALIGPKCPTEFYSPSTAECALQVANT